MRAISNGSAAARHGTAAKCQFASDNYAGICPEALQAVIEANQGYTYSYGDDDWTRRACEMLRERFETDCEVFFVFNGTAANALAVATLCKPFHSVICHESAHLETDECGAPEFFSSGSKVLLVPGPNGKVDLGAVERLVRQRSDIHYPKPHALSITQATELGTVYSVEEIREIGLLAKALHLRVHMDGSRLANAMATLKVPLKDITWKAGVDVVCLGGAKNGGALGEAVVFFDRELAEEFDYRCKQAGQLASKMRFLSAQWIGMLENDVWLRNARQANHCAQLLEERLRNVPGISIMFPRQANSVFVDMPARLAQAVRERGWHFYTFIGGGARFMCSWNSSEADVEALAADIRECAELINGNGSPPAA
ncbi:MAG TPA: low specificity L-threonine aldolase [Phycisphaerae bacterium]|nr:low specificity L-threonine aldolase [Phycisphaerae bacterium]HOJ75056.1 low specificity L-threonine aldolase [Phycisphaerae bacterium]HOM51927.1 low specificity L-threonine aldolase [Phycisphaerae bacterium]HON67221.1 low specificity L-threonine aldolase [Phycisphaerae bacterium]HPP28088.1 low specificity L-threonine aldolase [Phycisphaerae bacterium]